jgi:D-3-phosphoglycerate dehydrogenase / 2-oxoglutarate reductase
MTLCVLCAGDLFIRATSFADAARGLADEVVAIECESRWPDEPFGTIDAVREAAGDPAQLATLIADADVMLTHLAPVTRSMFEAAPRLRVVGVTRGGPVNVDLPAATDHGVPVLYLPGRNLEAVAEFVIGVMISLTRSVGAAALQLTAGTWSSQYFRFDRVGPELCASTVGLVGLGAVGARVAQLAKAFGSRVLAYDPYVAPDAAPDAELVNLPYLLASSDIVSLHARLTESTRKMIDAKVFATMKPGAYFINTARGELVDYDALRSALANGRLRGAALDVFDPEPPEPDDPLLRRANVIATPHLAGASQQVALESVAKVTADVGEFLRSGLTRFCANPDWVKVAQ